ncbi:DNA-3-methyladenine glycosylase I, partial [Acinetobacter soli]
AKRFIEIQQEFGSFDAYIWSFVDNTVIHNEWTSTDDIPATTELSHQAVSSNEATVTTSKLA